MKKKNTLLHFLSGMYSHQGVPLYVELLFFLLVLSALFMAFNMLFLNHF